MYPLNYNFETFNLLLLQQPKSARYNAINAHLQGVFEHGAKYVKGVKFVHTATSNEDAKDVEIIMCSQANTYVHMDAANTIVYNVGIPIFVNMVPY